MINEILLHRANAARISGQDAEADNLIDQIRGIKTAADDMLANGHKPIFDREADKNAE